MTTEDKALALVNEVAKECWQRPEEPYSFQIFETLCRAIEQHEAFRQEVSDAVKLSIDRSGHDGLRAGHINEYLGRFIIPKPKPDPLVEAWIEATGNTVGMEPLNAALEARGLEIREKGQ